MSSLRRFLPVVMWVVLAGCGSGSGQEADVLDDGTQADSSTAPKTSVVINEVSCKGDDWVELHNRGDEAVDISGWFVSDDDPGDPADMEALPTGTSLEPGEFRVFYETRDLNFGIKCGKETITLNDHNGDWMDSMSPPVLYDSQSWGLLDPSQAEAGVLRPTAGSPNEQTPLMVDDAPSAVDPPDINTGGICGAKNEESGTMVCVDTLVEAAEFQALSILENFRPEVDRISKFTAPASDDDGLLPALVQNVGQFPLHEDFLVQIFSVWFPDLNPDTYDELFARRATRTYYAGALYLFQDTGGYGFSAVTDPLDPEELLNGPELQDLRQRLMALLDGADIVYVPTQSVDEDRVLAWVDPPVPFRILEKSTQTDGQITYTSGTTYGWVRIYTQAALEADLEEGLVGWTDIVVVDQPPADLEVVVAGIITGAPQTELSHVTIRTSRRGTPNMYLQDAVVLLKDYEGKLVRLDTYPGAYVLTDDVTEEEAETFWAEHRPNLGAPPEIDGSYADFPGLLEVAVNTEEDRTLASRRFGGKGVGLAKLYDVLDAQYQLPGFLIPFHWHEAFLDLNTTNWEGQEVSYRELIGLWLEDDPFQSDMAYRKSVLEAFITDARENALIPDGLEQALMDRIETVFGGVDVMVRFRSSSNAEDALEFSGAGLYDSTSVCAADSLTVDLDIPSACDPNTGDERSIRRGLLRVWTSLWNFRAFEERSYFQIPNDKISMGILVNLRMSHENANGVLLTGLPDGPAPGDSSAHKYLVNAQWGDVEVVLPETGVLPERSLLGITDQIFSGITRVSKSNLIPEGYVVLPYSWAETLGNAVASIEADFPIDQDGSFDPERILLDLEWKFDRNGQLIIKQIRPFLVPEKTTPDGVLFAIPQITTLCSGYQDDRTIWRERKLRSRLELAPTQILLPFDPSAYPIAMDLSEVFSFSPDQKQLLPTGPGAFTLEKTTTWQDLYTFEFEQSFSLDDETVHLRWKLHVTAELDIPPTGEVSVIDSDALGFSACLEPCEGVNDQIPLTSCTMSGLDEWTHSFTFDDPEAPFTSVQIHIRHREEPVESGPLRIQYVELTRPDGSVLEISEFFQMAYSTERHNRSEDFLFTVEQNGETQFILLDEPDLLEPPTAYLKIFDATVSPLESYETTDYAKVKK